MDTTPRTRMLATFGLATLFGVLTATGMTSHAAVEDPPGHDRSTAGSCQTPDPAPAAGTAGLWFGPTMYAAR